MKHVLYSLIYSLIPAFNLFCAELEDVRSEPAYHLEARIQAKVGEFFQKILNEQQRKELSYLINIFGPLELTLKETFLQTLTVAQKIEFLGVCKAYLRHISTTEALRAHFHLGKSRYEQFKRHIQSELQLKKIPELLSSNSNPTARCVAAFKIDGFMPILCAHFSENKIAAVVGKTLALWDATTGACIALLSDCEDATNIIRRITVMEFDQSGRKIFAALNWPQEVVVLTPQYETMGTFILAKQASIAAGKIQRIRINRVSDEALFATDTGEIQIWDFKSKSLALTLPPQAVEDKPIHNLYFGPIGIIRITQHGALFYDSQKDTEPPRMMPLNCRLRSFFCDPDENKLFFVAADTNQIIMTDTIDMRRVRFLRLTGDRPEKSCCNDAGTLIAIISKDGSVAIYVAQTGELVAHYKDSPMATAEYYVSVGFGGKNDTELFTLMKNTFGGVLKCWALQDPKLAAKKETERLTRYKAMEARLTEAAIIDKALAAAHEENERLRRIMAAEREQWGALEKSHKDSIAQYELKNTQNAQEVTASKQVIAALRKQREEEHAQWETIATTYKASIAHKEEELAQLKHEHNSLNRVLSGERNQWEKAQADHKVLVTQYEEKKQKDAEELAQLKKRVEEADKSILQFCEQLEHTNQEKEKAQKELRELVPLIEQAREQLDKMRAELVPLG